MTRDNLVVLLALASVCIACAVYYRTAQRSAATARAARKAREDAAAVEWMRFTFVSITNADGELYFRSLRDLRDDTAVSDLVWARPGSVLIFTAWPQEVPADG